MSTAATVWDRVATWTPAEPWYATVPPVAVTPHQRIVYVTGEARRMEVTAR